VIGRLWHGWTLPVNAGAYEALLRTRVLPHIHALEGCRGGYLLRRDAAEEVEFVVLTFFDSLDAVRAFAGEEHEVAVVPPEARALLSRFDARVKHFETRAKPR
jgi:heme-degrading monooxygenase HmoA